MDREALSPEIVSALAKVADLRVEEDRLEVVAALLGGLLEDAARVNLFMSGRREIGPAARFIPLVDVQKED